MTDTCCLVGFASELLAVAEPRETDDQGEGWGGVAPTRMQRNVRRTPRIAWQGNPRHYACYLDEGLNILLRNTAARARRQKRFHPAAVAMSAIDVEDSDEAPLASSPVAKRRRPAAATAPISNAAH
eukprot:265928-Pyramimonas_sp.AAC.1